MNLVAPGEPDAARDAAAGRGSYGAVAEGACRTGARAAGAGSRLSYRAAAVHAGRDMAEVSGEPSHLGCAAHLAGSAGSLTGMARIGSGSDQLDGK